jgi:multidrug transporter EmrE-like cation transporter
MFGNRLGSLALPKADRAAAFIVALIFFNLLFNVLSNASFRLSAMSSTWRGVLNWQIVGNLAGFVTVITLTVLLRYLPLSIAFPLTTGLTVLGVQLIAASWLFHEPISQRQWIGTLAVVLGIWLIQR